MQLVSSAATITDVDTDMASSLVVTIPTLSPGDDFVFPETPLLSLRTEPTLGGSLEVTYTGLQPVQTYLDLLLTFTYRSTAEEPGTDTREIDIQIFTPSDTAGRELGSDVVSTVVLILPVNDNAPEFSQAFYVGSIVENASPGTPVGVVVMARDGDNSEGTNITFATSDPFFSVHPASGEVTSLAPLNAEMTPLYELTITASDNDNVSLSSSISVLINVTDVNDEMPSFNQTLYSASVREDTSIGSTLLTVEATDGDITDENSVITYSISAVGSSGSGDSGLVMTTGSPDDLPFAVDPTTGDITLTRSLDFDAGITVYEFTVLATDSGFSPLESSSRVRVYVTDVNDNAPQITNTIFAFTIEENTPFPSPVVLIRATDADTGAGGQIQFTLQGTGTFSINPTTGLLSLSGPLDFETNRTYSFLLVASDLGSPLLSSQETVSIAVGNANDNQPMFSEESYSFVIQENAPFSVEVLATDADGDSIVYREVSGFVPGIQLDPLTGEISGFALDFEVRDSFLLVVEAADSRFSVSVNVSVSVVDLNDQPPIFAQDAYAVEIDESLPLGASVLQVRAEDGDTMENAAIEYSVYPVEQPFRIDQSTGIIFVSDSLDFDTSPTSYLLNVTARNTAPPHFEDYAAVSISLLDANDISPVLSLDQLNVTFVENSEPVFLAADLTVLDGDSNAHPLAQCSVVLTKVCAPTGIAPCVEAVSVSRELANLVGLSVVSFDEASEQMLLISGNASESLYQSLLQTLEYSNSAPEPAPGGRNVMIQCQDEDFSSNSVDITVSVQLLNEFCPVVAASSTEFNFTEGSASLEVGLLAGFVVSDEDSRPHNRLQGLRIVLSNRFDAPFESISVNESAGLQLMSGPPPGMEGSGDDLVSTTQILVLQSPTGPQPLPVFQQALASLVYANTRPEPTVAPRVITVAPMDPSLNCSSVELTVNVLPVNDNPPELVLSSGNALQYLEESGPLAFAAEAGLMVMDPDHNDLFPMQAATVVLGGILDVGGSEVLQYATTALPAGVRATTSLNGTSFTTWGLPPFTLT